MRVTILQDFLRTGGTERQTLHLAQRFADEGVRVQLIVFRRGGTLSADSQPEALAVTYLKQGPLRTDWFAPGLAKTISDFAPDIVLPMGRIANCWSSFLAKPDRSFKLVTTLRTGRKLPFFYRSAIRKSDHLIANSHAALEKLKRQKGLCLPPEKTSVIHNACLTNPVSRSTAQNGDDPNRRVRLCCVSQFRKQKRHIHLIERCSKLSAMIDWSLDLAGDGPERAKCQRLASKLGLSHRIRFHGQLTDPSNIYRNADLAILVSEAESLPNFLVEAQMAGLPVVAYDTDGVKETFIDQQSGILVPTNEETSLVTAIERLARDACLRNQMSDTAVRFAQLNFSPDSQVTRYLERFDALLGTQSNG